TIHGIAFHTQTWTHLSHTYRRDEGIIIWSCSRSIRYTQLQYPVFHSLLYILFLYGKILRLTWIVDDVIYLKIVACRLYIVPYPYQAIDLYHLHLITSLPSVDGCKCCICRHPARVKVFCIYQTLFLFSSLC